MKKAFSLVLAVVMILAIGCIGVSAADVTITPTATIGGQTVTMTATGLQDNFTNFDIGSIFGMPGGFGYTYALWFDADGTFSFDKDVTLTHQYFDASFNSIGTDEVVVKAGEVIKVADGVYSQVNGTTVSWSEFSVALDDGNSWMIIEAANPGNYASTPADTALSAFPGTVGTIAAAAPAPAEEPAAPAEEPAAPAEEPAAPAEEPAAPAEEPAAPAEEPAAPAEEPAAPAEEPAAPAEEPAAPAAPAAQPAAPSSVASPQTGDSTLLWVALALTVLCAGVCFIYAGKKCKD